MIRLIYFSAFLFEFILVLAVLFLFIVTDARNVKLFAKESLQELGIHYQSIEGNFFSGLELHGVSYQNQPLFDTAKVHWNPVTLLNGKITLQEVNVTGVELKNIVKMVNDFDAQEENSSAFEWNFSLLLQKIHLDMKPYRFKGVTFTHFLFESDRVFLSKEFLLDSSKMYLQFDSDLLGLRLKGDINKSNVLLKSLDLEKIDSKAIAQFVRGLDVTKKREKDAVSPSAVEPFIKKIKVVHLNATLKKVTYSPVTLSKSTLSLNGVEIDPYHAYQYKAKKLTLHGETTFGTLLYEGFIQKSTLHAKGSLHLSEELFKKYHLPLNYAELKRLKSKIKLNHDGIWLEIHHKAKKFLELESDFNMDILSAGHQLHYDYHDNNLTILTHLTGKMPYADIVTIDNRITVDEKEGFRYRGKIKIPKVKGLPKDISEYLLEGLTGDFKGTSANFESLLESNLLEGNFKITDNYQKAFLRLNSKGRCIALKRFTHQLPPSIKGEKVSLKSKTSFDFKAFENSNTQVKLFSRMVNLNLNMGLTEPFKIKFTSTLSPHSILPKMMNPKINLASVLELTGEVSLFPEIYFIHLKGKDLNLLLEYNPLNKKIEKGTFSLNKSKFFLYSLDSNRFKIISHLSEIKELLKSLQHYFKMPLPSLSGSIGLDVRVEKNGSVKIKIKTPHIQYKRREGAKTSLLNFYDIDTVATIDREGNIEIEHYKFRVDENGYLSHFFSDKSSYITLKDKRVSIKEFWINNKLLLSGVYKILDAKGDFNLRAKHYAYRNKDVDLLVDVNLDATLNNKRVSLSGDVDILGNRIRYEMVGSDIVEDSDIIIVQEEREKADSPLNNLSLDIAIKSKKELRYLSKEIDVAFLNDLHLMKKFDSDVLLTGVSTVTKGYYRMEDKYFTLEDTHLYFAGEPKKPLLDIKADYQKDEYTIHIFISGSTEEPIVNFTSEPYLTQQEILSLILFDGTGTRNGGGAEAYTLLGGTFAKGIIRSLGIDVDHLLLGTDESDNLSFEIGRKISKEITIIYQHENGKDGVKTRIEHTKNFETDIVIQPPNSSSIEFLYQYSE